jgi:phage gp36-like protein
MPYCTLADLQKAIPLQTLVWLSNDDASAVNVNAGVIDDAIQYAGREVNRYIAGRYTLPLDQATDDLTDIAVHIARHYLYARRPEGHDFPEAVTRTYSGALSALRDIRDGKMTLGIQATGAANDGATVVRVNARPRLFGADTLGQY